MNGELPHGVLEIVLMLFLCCVVVLIVMIGYNAWMKFRAWRFDRWAARGIERQERNRRNRR